MNICPSCLQTTTGKKFCPYCGFNVESYAPEEHHIPMLKTVGGRYKVGRCLGEDGFCITYTALDETTGQRCTLKEFYPSDISERKGHDIDRLNVVPLKGKEELYAKTLARVEKDAKVLASLEHMEGMVKVLGCVSENNTVYTAVEFAEGFSAAAYLRENGGKLPADEVFRLMKAPMEALAKVHKAGVYHRGINPEHIIFTEDEKIVLIGFGSARDYDNGKSLAPGYAAPEQYRTNGVVNEATDVYSLCALIYYLLTGKRPQAPAQRMSMDELVKPSELCDISEAREKTLLNGLEIAEGKRIQSVDELIEGFYGEDEASEEELEPAAAINPEPAAAINPEPAAAINPEPAAAINPEPAAAINPEPVAATKPEPAAAIKPEPAAATKPEPVPAEKPKPAPEPKPEPAEEYRPVPEKKKSKAPAVVLVCLLLAGIGVGAMMYMNGSFGGGAPAETAPVETTAETVPEETKVTEVTEATEAETDSETETDPNKVIVPDLLKNPLSIAINRLEGENINYTVIETEDTSMPPEFVIKQEPPAGVEMPIGAPVRIYVSKRPEDTAAPETTAPAAQPAETTAPQTAPAAQTASVTTAETTAPRTTSAPHTTTAAAPRTTAATTVPRTTGGSPASRVTTTEPASEEKGAAAVPQSSAPVS